MKTLEQTVPIPSDLPVYLKLAMVTMIWAGPSWPAGSLPMSIFLCNKPLARSKEKAI